MAYNPNKDYVFTSEDGETFMSHGDNQYVWQAMETGLPISVNDKGDWFVTPYLDRNADGQITAYIPNWFKNTDAYNDWLDQTQSITLDYAAQMTNDDLSNLNKYLKSLGNMGTVEYVTRKTASENYGLQGDQLKRYADAVQGAYNELAGGDKTSFTIDDRTYDSLEDFAIDYMYAKNREEVSDDLTKAYRVLDNAGKNMETYGRYLPITNLVEKVDNTNPEDLQKAVADALIKVELLQAISDSKTWKNGMFQGILDSSFQQQFLTGVGSFYSAAAQNPVLNIGLQLANWATGRNETPEETINKFIQNSSAAGASLKGREAAISVGGIIGTIANITVTALEMKLLGFGFTKLGGAISQLGAVGATVGNLLMKTGTFASSFWGIFTADLLLNDLPQDLMTFFSRMSKGTSAEVAWDASNRQQEWTGYYDKLGKKVMKDFVEDRQKLVPILVYPTWDENGIVSIGSGVGPEVPSGLKYDIVGDVIADLTMPFINMFFKGIPDKIDQVTGGLRTRIHDNIALKNFEIQDFLAEHTIAGRAIRKMVDGFMGPEVAGKYRQAKKDAIAQHSMKPYYEMEVAITAQLHGGSNSVLRAYTRLEKLYGVTDDINKFQKNAKQYGGMGKTTLPTESYRLGRKITKTKEVDDVVPREVRAHLDRVDELNDLQRQKRDGVAIDSKHEAWLQREIQNAPQEFKDFTDKLSGLNKAVERLGAELGINDKEWVDHLVQDPQYKQYLTRQALLPDYSKAPSERQPEISGQWTRKREAARKDFTYVDPVVALRLKVVALGKAVADNEVAKVVAASQLHQEGAILKGAKNIEYTQRIDTIKKEIAKREATGKATGINDAKGSYSADANNMKKSFTAVFDAMMNPEEVNLKSVYDSTSNPALKEHIQRIENGKIRIGDDALSSANLTDNEAVQIVTNTYRLGEDGKVKRNVPDNKIDNPVESSAPDDGLPTYAGVTDNGVPYSYTIENGKVVSFKQLSSPEELADSARSLGYELSPEDAAKYGADNVAALNRAALFYNQNAPSIPLAVSFAIAPNRSRKTMGWIEWPGSTKYNYRFEKGRIAADFRIFCAEGYYAKDKGSVIDNALKKSAESRFHPKNSNDRANTPIHELGHSFLHRLTVLDINRRIESGELKAWADDVQKLAKIDPQAANKKIGEFVSKEWIRYQEGIAKDAMDDLGIQYNGNNWKKKWRELSSRISKYAADETNNNYKSETFSEAFVDYWANNTSADPFTLAIMGRLAQEGNKYAQAADPIKVMKKNGLQIKGIFNEKGEYDFGNAKTAKQKAQWLNEKRQDNPYIPKKGRMTADQYIKANRWDTFFRKEALSYNKNVKLDTPQKLLDANTKFQEYTANNKVKFIMDEVKKRSNNGVDEEVVTMLLSDNKKDVDDALQTFITKRIDAEAEKITERMTSDERDRTKNMDRARVTLYSDEQVIESTVDMAASMVPDISRADVEETVRNIMDDRAKGFAAVEALPTETRALYAEIEELKAQIKKENKKVIQAGSKANAEMTGEGTHIIKYREEGMDVYVAVSDPMVASLLQGPENFKEVGVVPEALVHIGRFFSRLYRLGTTGLNPVALVRNIIRDPVQAMYTAGFSPMSMNISPKAFFYTLKSAGLDDYTAKRVSEMISDWAQGNTLTKEIKDLNKNGSDITALTYRNKAEKVAKKLDKLTDNKIIDMAEHPLDAWEGMLRTQIGQQSFLKSFKATKDVDLALSRAMFDASNATTNFAHSIGKFKRATSTIPYLTSAVNGTGSFWRLFNADPLGMTTRIMGGFVVPVMALTAWNLSSDERKERYKNLPEWWKDGHLILLDAEGNQIFAFTIPEEIQAFYGLARRYIEYTEEVSPSSLATILAQGALDLLPGDAGGFVNEYGEWDLKRGFLQFGSGLIPQAVTFAYELWAEENLYTGEDLSGYTAFNKTINALGNVFGAEIKNVINDIGYMSGASEKMLVGKTTANTLARDLFGLGFDNATTQFMNLIGNRAETVNGKQVKATGLFKERDELLTKLDSMTRDAAYADEDEQAEVERQKQYEIDKFVSRVAMLTNKYMQLYSVTGGLEDWQKKKIVSLLNLAPGASSAPEGSYQQLSANEASLDEYGLGLQRYVEAGLPAGATRESNVRDAEGNLERSLEARAALNSYYGASKQARADLINTATSDNLKNLKNRFYDFISQIYDEADAQGVSPDYDLIERTQARYIQAVDSILMPIINQYGINVLSNADFVDQVRKYVNGMIPSDDWRKSEKNAKKYLSTKEFPTATVDVKKWLRQHYAASMKDRDIESDAVVTNTLNQIENDINSGNGGAAQSKINLIMEGRDNADFYISPADLRKLLEYKNMLK